MSRSRHALASLCALATVVAVMGTVTWWCRDATVRAGTEPMTVLEACRQIVLVTTPSWNAPQGRLQRWERASAQSPWTQAGEKIRVVVGRNGLAWGRGLLPLAADHRPGPRKREGDGRSPAGIFALPEAFGFAPRSEACRFVRLPYRQLTPDTECIDDALSRSYNRMVQGGQRDWSSSEKMRQVALYRWGAWVSHNDAPPQGGAGSCIFLHIWKDARSGTAGCTAMPEADLKALLAWLDPAASPVLVQLPRQERENVRQAWGLPEGD